MENKIPLSVVIITRNEESNIKACLESVKWADEIVVVDDNSTDRTVEICREHTDRIFHKKMDIEGRHRNWAHTQPRNSWVLSLDADERVTSQLREEIIETINKGPEFKGYSIPRRNYIGNYWVRYGGWYPSPQLKLFKKEDFRWEEAEVHPRAFLNGPAGRLNNDIIHYSYKNFEDFLNKMNKQTTLEAIKWVKDKRRMGLGRAVRRTCDRFLRSFFRKKAYKDGFTGFVVSVFAGFYQILSYAKYWEMKNGFGKK
ncbi:MAG: glycosyltransferase family 2 protein [Candidatus Omnitrophota bacterium]|nr:MAG: glycosyltransferase family 2 protein [Candidatus Omnitrophota bacterium]